MRFPDIKPGFVYYVKQEKRGGTIFGRQIAIDGPVLVLETGQLDDTRSDKTVPNSRTRQLGVARVMTMKGEECLCGTKPFINQINNAQLVAKMQAIRAEAGLGKGYPGIALPATPSRKSKPVQPPPTPTQLPLAAGNNGHGDLDEELMAKLREQASDLDQRAAEIHRRRDHCDAELLVVQTAREATATAISALTKMENVRQHRHA